MAKQNKRPRKAKPPPPPFPSEDEIREFIREATGKVGKREIARAFNIKGAQRIKLKKILKNMTEAGLLRKDARKLSDAEDLPPVLVAEVMGQDDDGELYAEPTNWEGDAGDPPRILLRQRRSAGRDSEKRPPGEGDRVLVRITRTTDETYPYDGKIIRRLTRSDTRIIGVFRKQGKEMRVEQVERSARNDLNVATGDDKDARDGELVSVELVRNGGRGLKTARVRERLGALDDQRNISLIALSQHGIPDTFSEDLMAEANGLKEADAKGRTDLRNVPLITIDPADARDHDDAIWAELTDNGCRVIVAIADVSWYVRPGTLLDKEARVRGNSVYFPDRVVPMLPERLSNDLCSLKEVQDRPALAAIMEFDKSGRKTSHKFDRVLIKVAANVSYEEAQAAIDGKPKGKAQTLLEPVLKPLWAAYDMLSKGRSAREPLELDVPERKIILKDDGTIDRVVIPDRLDAHKLVEEFMIQANVCAAETLEDKRTPLIYRVHDAPSDEKMRALHEFLQTIKVKLTKAQVMKPALFNRILAEVRGRDVELLLNEVVLRTQSQAVYAPDNLGHFGLNLRRYAHFTSPIRRYADLIVHRALVTGLKLGEGGLSDFDLENLTETAEIISTAERRAMAAERETKDRLMAAWLSEHVGGTFKGRIAGVTRSGLFVKLQESGADGFVPASTILGDYYIHDEAAHAMVGERTGETFRLGDKVDVRLQEVTPLAGGLRFELLSEGRRGKPLKRKPRGAHKKKKERRSRVRRR
ncbi:MAG: ribonuclease R [Hyphomicrobiales bacterium]